VSFIFCQLLPKTLCRYWANRIVLYVAAPLMWSERFFLPFVNFFTSFANTIARMVNPSGLKKNPFITKDDIKSLIKDISREGILDPQEKDAIDKIFEMTLTKAVDVMVPLKKVVYFDTIEEFSAVKVKARGSAFTRFPVFDGAALKGMINIFDVLYSHCSDWQACLRPIVRVEHDESLDKVFAKMQPNQETLAAVYKGQEVVGILTIEDLMEQITARLTAVKK
jgi:CBS domain containing-hemolysin-like protein